MKRLSAILILLFAVTQVFGQLNLREIYEDDIKMSGTGSLQVPSGTTGERTTVPINGMFRYNTSTSEFEGYNGTWGAIGGVSTFQDTYINSTQPQLTLNASQDGFRIIDNSTPIASPFFEILSNDTSTNYFTVDSSGISLTIGATVSAILDEDNMASDSSTALATQQSIKAYVDASSPLSAEGQLYGHNGTTSFAIPAGNNSEFAVYDDSVTGNIKWSNQLQGLLNPVGDRVSYTPVFTGFGTVSNIDFFYTRVGDMLHVQGRFQVGTPTATEARISLPSGLNVDRTKITSGRAQVGRGARNVATSTGADYSVNVDNTGDTYVVFGLTNSGIIDSLDAADGDEIISSGNLMSIFFSVPISGWDSGLNVVIEDRDLTADDVNQFNASFDGSSSTGTNPVTVNSEDFAGIITCDRVSTGVYNCSINTITLTVVPAIQCTISQNEVGNADRKCTVRSKTVSSFRIDITSGAPTSFDNDFDISLTKQGVDYIKKQVIAANIQDLNLSTIPTYADDAAAGVGGLTTGDVYKTASGELRIKL